MGRERDIEFNKTPGYFKSGSLRADKILYRDGIGCSIWQMIDEEDEMCGLVMDFTMDDVDDMINIMELVKNGEYEEYDYSKDDEEKEKEAKKSKFRKFLENLKLLEFAISPFYWRILYHKTMQRLQIGPFSIDW